MNLTSHDYNEDGCVVDAVAAPHPAHSKSTIPRPPSSLDMTNFGLHLAMELLGPARVMEHIELHQRFAPFETRIPPRLVYIPPLYWRSRLFIPKELATDKATPLTAANVKEQRGLWLWQALMNQPSQHSGGSTSLDCTVKHSLLYFDITFEFIKKNAMIASDSQSEKSTMMGSIDVSIRLCFAHYTGGNGCPGISGAEYFMTYPLLSSNLENHLKSMKFDINSVATDTLASMMATEFLRQGHVPIPHNLVGKHFDVTYPEQTTTSTIDLGCESEIQMNIPYKDVILGVGVLILTTKRPVAESERYTNAQLKHIYRDLTQDLHYYDEDQRSHNIDAVVQSNPPPTSKSSSPPSNVSTCSRAGESDTNSKTGDNTCGVKRKLNMSDRVAHAGGDTAENELKLQVIKAFDEWKARQSQFRSACASDDDAKNCVSSNDSAITMNTRETSTAVQSMEENGATITTASTGSPDAVAGGLQNHAHRAPVFPKKSKPYRRRRAR
jgi:hypothetical protein